jgi:hypothetical protein
MEDNNAFLTPNKATWTLVWGGEKFVAPSAFDILATIGERSYIPSDRKYPKRGIAYRVFVQHRVLIDDELSDEEFLTKLAEFGIAKLTVEGVRPPDILDEAVLFSQAWHGGTD